jgi:hypothetical protein
MRVATGTYTGDGQDNRHITGAGFTPAMVWVFYNATDPTTVSLCWKIPAMGTKSNISGAGETSWGIKSLDGDGFTVRTGDWVNALNEDYHWVAFGADAACLKTGYYYGDGNDNRDIPGIGFQPDFVWVSNIWDTTVIWYATKGGDSSVELFADAYDWRTNNIQGVGADSFQVGNYGNVNFDGQDYYYFCLKNVVGNVLQQSYEGNGADDRDIVQADPFSPALLLVRHGSGGTKKGGIFKPDTLAGDLAWKCYWDGWGARSANWIQALNADGFQVGSAAEVNENGITFHYLAIADVAPVVPIEMTFGIPVEFTGQTLSLVHLRTVLRKLSEPFVHERTVIPRTIFSILHSRTIKNLLGAQVPHSRRVLSQEIVTLFGEDIQLPVGKAEKP